MNNMIIVIDFLGLLATQVLTAEVLSTEANLREEATNTLQDRVRKLESHFVGHTAVLAKNGAAVSIVPCNIQKDKHCYPDDSGITLNNMVMEGWDYGVNIEDHGTKQVPKRDDEGQLNVKRTAIGGIKDVNYSGPNNWRWRLTLFWDGIKQAFCLLWNPPI
jgi:hypothetical protein